MVTFHHIKVSTYDKSRYQSINAATIFNVTTTRCLRSLVAPPQRGAGVFFCVADVWPGKRTRRLRCERQNHGEDVLQEKPQAQQRQNDKSMETRLFVARARLAHVVLNALKTTGEVVRGFVSYSASLRTAQAWRRRGAEDAASVAKTKRKKLENNL